MKAPSELAIAVILLGLLISLIEWLVFFAAIGIGITFATVVMILVGLAGSLIIALIVLIYREMRWI